jgi:hypothetical protein
MFEDQEALAGMKKGGDDFAFGGRDLVGSGFGVKCVVGVDAAGAAQREVEIEQRGRRAWTQGGGFAVQVGLADFERNLAGAATSGFVLMGDSHLEDLVGLLPASNFGMGDEGEHAFLKTAETALHLAHSLRSGRASL